MTKTDPLLAIKLDRIKNPPPRPRTRSRPMLSPGMRVQYTLDTSDELQFGVVRRAGAVTSEYWVDPDDGGDPLFLTRGEMEPLEPTLIELADNLREAWRRLDGLRALARLACDSRYGAGSERP